MSNRAKRATMLHMKEKAKQYLGRDPLYYVGFFDMLEAPNTRILYAAEDGLLLYNGWLNCLSARSETAVRSMLPRIIGNDALAFEDILYEPLEKLGFRRDMLCYPCCYTSPRPLPIELPAGVEIRPLTHEHDDFVLEHYRHGEGDADYMRSRIDDGMFGLFENGVLAGFIGIHGGGEMGLLEVLPAYRRKGYALLLEARMINHRLALGHLPHGEVETWNEASMALQRRLGMTFSENTCAWFERG